MWRHGLGTDEHQAVVDCRIVTKKHYELLERSPDEIFDERYAQKREQFEQMAGPLRATINSPNLRPEAQALLDEQLPSWLNTPEKVSKLLQPGLSANVIRDYLEGRKTQAVSRQHVEPTHRQLRQAQIDALRPDTVTVHELLEQMIEFKKLKGSIRRR